VFQKRKEKFLHNIKSLGYVDFELDYKKVVDSFIPPISMMPQNLKNYT